MPYLLDANVLIAAKNLYYGFDFCPAFWDWVIRENRAGRVFSVSRVLNEITGGDDDPAEWVRQLDSGFFLPPDASTADSFTAVAQWVDQAQPYTPAAKNTFLQIADYYLVAQAHALRYTVVTQERPENSRNRVKIPNVCLALNIPYLNTFEMPRAERARFTLRT